MNPLEEYFTNNTGHLIHKWHHYFEIYNRHFSRYRNTNVVILEIGVSHGGSLQMWKHYFGNNALIYGVDVNPECKKLEEDQIEIFIGSQEDRNFLQELKTKIPKIDILIDDGGHTMKQQILTFEELYDHVKEDGIYLCEDIQTSYWPDYDGGYRRRGTFIDYSKNFIDYLHAWHSMKKSKLDVNNFTRTAFGLHFYDCVLVIEKRPMSSPYTIKSGNPTLTNISTLPLWNRIINKIKRHFFKLIYS